MPGAVSKLRSVGWADGPRKGESRLDTGCDGPCAPGHYAPRKTHRRAGERRARAANAANAGDSGFGSRYGHWGIPDESFPLSTDSFSSYVFPTIYQALCWALKRKDELV